MQPQRNNRQRIPLWLVILCLGIVSLLVAGGVWAKGHVDTLVNGQTASTPTPAPTHAPTASPTPKTARAGQHEGRGGISPLLFGTNLILQNSSDQFITSSTTRQLLKQIHVNIIRMPIRDNAPESTNVLTAQTIKQLGATPLVILHGASDADSLAVGTRVIPDMNRIFGKSVVYYEFGNENDLEGVAAARYAARWNAIIPQFRALATNGRFVGPVISSYKPDYINTFLAQANPHPDVISWHEYTCDAFAASSTCIANLSHWTTHVQEAHAAMKANVGKEIPIMITEWNYAPNPALNDGKNTDSVFMRTWTTTALKTLAANHVFGSMQYACTHPLMTLINSSAALAPQGEAFGSAYQQLMHSA